MLVTTMDWKGKTGTIATPAVMRSSAWLGKLKDRHDAASTMPGFAACPAVQLWRRRADTKSGVFRIDLTRAAWEDSTYHFDRNDPVAGWSKSQWQKHIRARVATPANVIFTIHAQLRMRQRHISHIAAFEVLKKGVILREPEPNLRRGTLECRMEYYVAGRNLALVAAVDAGNPAVIVVTAIDLDKE